MPEALVETAQPTRRITNAVLWMLALVMVYPYLPGSDSPVFKGISVFVGLVISLGASGVVGQYLSGLVIMYSRALRVGDYVRVADHEGVVVALGMLSTKIRTNKREEVNIPNNLLVSTTTKNFSRLAGAEGVILYTTVTIGYDAPWRQVHAMLIEAAHRTPGLRTEPPSFVNQTALSDFYVEYQLNAHLERPEARIRVLADLHANIQDVFNEHGVQIMSPHYETDPADKKWVPRERWHEPPAAAPDRTKGD
jgi:small-conductance mechanosensitive channel